MAKGFQLTEETPDRDYFTIVPNYIINHSTIWERDVYLIMKRIAGEKGTCYATQDTIAKKVGVSRPTISKTIKKLLKRGWIKDTGKLIGKTKLVHEYQIVDLWKLNSDYYSNKNNETVNHRTVKLSTTEQETVNHVYIEEEHTEEDNINIDESTFGKPKVDDKKIDISELVDSMGKEERIRYEYQLRGLQIWETLTAPVNKKSEFIRIVRDYSAGLVNEAFSFAQDYPVPKIRYMMFFKKLNQLNKKGKNV